MPLDGGFTRYHVCKRRHPVVFVSDDGATWTESAPAGLAPPGGSSLRINDLTIVGDRFVAAGTIEGPGWRAVLFSSPDGVTWTAEREFVGDGNPMSSESVAYDGSTLVLTTFETPVRWGGRQHRRLAAGRAGSRGRAGSSSAPRSPRSRSSSRNDHPLAPLPFEPPDPANPCGLIDGIPFPFFGFPIVQRRADRWNADDVRELHTKGSEAPSSKQPATPTTRSCTTNSW